MKATVIPPELWNYNLSLPHFALMVYIMGLMDRDGICRLEITAETASKLNLTTERFFIGANQLEALGFMATYSFNEHIYAWSPLLTKTQPNRGKFSRDRNNTLPAPPKEKVFDVVKKLFNLDDEKKVKSLCPRAWGIKRNSSTIAVEEVRGIFEEWQKRQRRPGQCLFNVPVRNMIKTPLEMGFTALQLKALVEFAYEADHPAARFWQGDNERRRKYLGIDSLFRTSKLTARIAIISEYVELNHSKHSPSGAIADYYRFLSEDSDGYGDSPNSSLNLQQSKILSLLIEKGSDGVWTQELARVALKYSARISELRALGYSISVIERTDHGNNRYALKSRKTIDATDRKMRLVRGEQ